MMVEIDSASIMPTGSLLRAFGAVGEGVSGVLNFC